MIDFGDSQRNPVLYELGITIMYMMTRCTVVAPHLAGGHVVRPSSSSPPFPPPPYSPPSPPPPYSPPPPPPPPPPQVAGYLRHRQLTPLERRLLRVTVAARYAQSLVGPHLHGASDTDHPWKLD